MKFDKIILGALFNKLSIEKQTFVSTDTLNISFELSNIGKYDATDVAQLSENDLVGSIARPVKELKHFQRIDLKAGETKK